MKRDMNMFENKFQKAMHDVGEEKSRLMQKLMNEKTNPDYVNQVQYPHFILDYITIHSPSRKFYNVIRFWMRKNVWKTKIGD